MKFIIPIKFIFNNHEKKKINSQIKKLGLSIQYGGRVSNLGDKVNKSKAINVFLKTGAQCSEFNSTDITNVNIIRTLLNICFKQTIEDVRDKYFWSSSHNKNFIEINLDEIKP